jgi:hypothetical protein
VSSERTSRNKKFSNPSPESGTNLVHVILVWAFVLTAGAFFLGLSTFRDLNVVAREKVVMHHSASSPEPFPEGKEALFTRPSN